MEKLMNHRKHQTMIWEALAIGAGSALIGDMFGGGGGSYPGLSPEELELMRVQLEGYKSAIAENRALRPLILQQMGLVEEGGATPETQAQISSLEQKKRDAENRLSAIKQRGSQFDVKAIPEVEKSIADIDAQIAQLGGRMGTLRQMTEEERLTGMTELQRKQYDITSLELDRQQRALRGELPVTEALTQQKKKEFEIFKEAQARQGNIITGDTPEEAVAQSTSGIQSLRQFRERYGVLEEAQRFGQLERGTGAVGAQYGLLANIPQQRIGQLTAFPQRNLGFLTAGQNLMQPYQQQRYGEYQAGEAQRGREAGLLSDIGRFAGTYYGLRGGFGGSGGGRGTSQLFAPTTFV